MIETHLDFQLSSMRKECSWPDYSSALEGFTLKGEGELTDEGAGVEPLGT
jgi:hypothetical protein